MRQGHPASAASFAVDHYKPWETLEAVGESVSLLVIEASVVY